MGFRPDCRSGYCLRQSGDSFLFLEKDFGNYYKNPARFGSQRLKKINECTSGAKVFSGSRKGYVLIPIILTPSTKNSRPKKLQTFTVSGTLFAIEIKI